MTWLLIASLYSGYTPEITTSRHATEQECIQHGNRLVANDTRIKFFCTNVGEK